MTLPDPTPLSPTVRYPLFGNRVYTWVPAIANKNAPSLSELNAGTDLTGEVFAATGFGLDSTNLPAPDAGGSFVAQTAGRQTAADSSLTIYCDLDGDDARSLLTYRLAGFVVIYTAGIVSGGLLSVWPVRVNSNMNSQDIEANATMECKFVITSVPAEDIAIPTS